MPNNRSSHKLFNRFCLLIGVINLILAPLPPHSMKLDLSLMAIGLYLTISSLINLINSKNKDRNKDN